MGDQIQYDPAAANCLIGQSHFESIAGKLTAARDEVLRDIELLNSNGKIPQSKQPLDAGFINLPTQLLEEYDASRSKSLVGRIEKVAKSLRSEVDRFVVLGIGGSYMGARALFEALCRPYHNEFSRKDRDGIPRIHFEGNNLDNDTVRGLLELLKSPGGRKSKVADRWAMTVISKSGGTLETAVAFRLFRKALEKYYGKKSAESRRFVVPVTGATGKLRELSNAKGYENVFEIPNNVGGRFSVFTAVGLFPAAVMGLDIRKLLCGAAEMTDQFFNDSVGKNPVLDYTATCHLLEEKRGMNVRVLSTWGARLEALGLWYDQLLAESLGKKKRGATPITVVNTRDLHSRGQQHQEGTPDKLITNVIMKSPSSKPLVVPASKFDQDQLNRLKDKTVPDLLTAAISGTNRAYADAKRPTADILLPRLSERNIGRLLQMLMLATVVEGRLIGINPYGQSGVEAYKKNMAEILDR